MKKVSAIILCFSVLLSLMFGLMPIRMAADSNDVRICCDEDFYDVRQ